jgi:hypothetical protein
VRFVRIHTLFHAPQKGLEATMDWKTIATPRPFLNAAGRSGVEDMLRAAFGVLAGRSDDNTLARLLKIDPSGRRIYMNDDCWWLFTDFQCHFHALWGWRPFCNSGTRDADFSTWSASFTAQVTPELQEHYRQKFHTHLTPPVGWIAAQYSGDPKHPMHDSLLMYYNNTAPDEAEWAFQDDKLYPGSVLFAHFGTHDLNPDYQLMNCVTATDWILWERNVGVAREYLPKIETYLRALETRLDAGYFLFGPQGSHIEWGHAGFRRQASTHVYYWKVLRNLAEAWGMIGEEARAERCRAAAAAWEPKVRKFEAPGGWFVSGYSKEFDRTFGSGRIDGSKSDYLEVWVNVISAMTGVMDRPQCRALADRFEAFPPFTENHLTISNYPARPADELDPDHNFPSPGTHLNGGFHWMHSEAALDMYARGGQPRTLERFEGLLEDHAKHLSVDYYNQWGANKERQWPHHVKGTHSITCAGMPGHFFRGTLGLWPCAKALRVEPASQEGLDRLEMLEPVTWGGKQILFTLAGQGTLKSATLNDKPLELAGDGAFELPFDSLPDQAKVEIALR